MTGNRWPWIALALCALLMVGAVVAFLMAQSRSTELAIEGTPTINPVARATGSVGPPCRAGGANPFLGQFAGPGGLGNTRADLDTAYGLPTGETPDHRVVFRKNSVEYRVQLAPDLNGRAVLVEEVAQQPLTLDAAQAEARKLPPRDAQPPSPPPEGNDQFVVQRFTSQSLAAALDPAIFSAAQADPGSLLAVYVKDSAQQGRITRIIVGIANDPAKLIRQ